MEPSTIVLQKSPVNVVIPATIAMARPHSLKFGAS
jgi:hypothetical protein